MENTSRCANNRASAQPCNTRRASGAPRLVFSDFGKPPPGLPCSMAKRYGFSVTQKGRYPSPNYEERANTPSQTRPETPASPTWASTAVTGTFHALPSSGLGKPPSRTLLLSYVACPTDPLLSEISTTDYSHVFLHDLYTLQRSGNTQ